MLSACSQKTHRIISPGGGAAGVPKPQARLEQGLGTARSPQLLRGARASRCAGSCCEMQESSGYEEPPRPLLVPSHAGLWPWAPESHTPLSVARAARRSCSLLRFREI